MLRLYILNLIMGITNSLLDIKYNFVRTILVIVIVIYIMDKFKNKDADAKKVLFSFIALQILFFVFLIIAEYTIGRKFYKFVSLILPTAQAIFISLVKVDGGLYFIIFGVIIHIFNKNKKSYILVTISCILIYNTNIIRGIFDIIINLSHNIYPILAFIFEISFGEHPRFMRTDLLYGNPQ